MSEKVAILGASDKPERYSNKALHMLKSHGHEVYLVSPRHSEIEGEKVYPDLKSIPVKLDTITMYVNPSISAKYADEILAASPKRVIFNPGTESNELAERLESSGIATEEACTLVLLSTNQF